MYKLPDYLFVDPIELNANETRPSLTAGLLKGFLAVNLGGESHRTNVVDTPITAKIKINPSDVAIYVETNAMNTVEELKRCIYERTVAMQPKEGAATDKSPPPVCEESRQRIIFMGKELKNEQILGDVGLDESRVLQVFLRKA